MCTSDAGVLMLLLIFTGLVSFLYLIIGLFTKDEDVFLAPEEPGEIDWRKK